MIFAQIFDMVDIGVVILDKDLKIYKWNRWMELHSRITSEEIIGHCIFDFFPTKCRDRLGLPFGFRQTLSPERR